MQKKNRYCNIRFEDSQMYEDKIQNATNESSLEMN